MSESIIRFGIFSDLHYAKENDGNRFKSLSIEKLRVAMQAFKNNSIDFILNLGDTIDMAPDLSEEENLCKEIITVLNYADIPVYNVIGNHDVAMFSKEEYMTIMGMKSSYYSFKINGIKFCILDGNYNEDDSNFARNNFSWDNAWLSKEQIKWLTGELNDDISPTIICCHERLDGVIINAQPDPHVIKNYMVVQNIIHQSNNVIAVFCGHDHSGYLAMINNLPYITCPAMVVDQSTSYAIVEIFSGNSIQINGVGRFPRQSYKPLHIS